MNRYFLAFCLTGYFLVPTASAGEVTDTFTAGTPLTAGALTNIKNAINDNHQKISTLQSPTDLDGTYQVITSTGDSDTAYITFNDTTHFYTAYLEQGQNKFHSKYSGVYMATSGQILGYDGLLNYTLSALGALTLADPNRSISAIRVTTDLTNWVTSLNILDTITLSGAATATDLAWDGAQLWHGNAYGGSTLYAINPVTRVVTSNVTTTEYAWGMAWENGNLWLSSNGYTTIKRFTFSANTLTANLTVDNLGPWINSITWDGSNIWAFSSNDKKLTRFNPATPTVLTVSIFTTGLTGMAYFSNDLFVVSNNTIHRLNPVTLVTKASYTVNSADNVYRIEGIEWDGSNMWVSATDYANSQTVIKLLKLDFVP